MNGSGLRRTTGALAACVLAIAAMGPVRAADDPADAGSVVHALWPGKAPGTERWTLPETVTRSPAGDRVLANVSAPTLTAFLPPAAAANGAAVIIAPGGGLRVLGYDNEGVKVARWLNEHGIAAFVLKYRTLQVAPSQPVRPPPPSTAPRQELSIRNANANPEPDNEGLAEVLRMAVDDAAAGLRLVRRNAAAWKVDPARVGFMGFSAGGGVAIALAMQADAGTRPDFLVSLYGPSLVDVAVRPDSPPLFIAVGASHFNVTKGCVALFDAWRTAGRPVELHVYDQVSAGFGMSPRGLPVDGWIDRLGEWLAARKLVPPNSFVGQLTTH